MLDYVDLVHFFFRNLNTLFVLSFVQSCFNYQSRFGLSGGNKAYNCLV